MHALRSNPWAWAPPSAALFLMIVVYVTGTNHSLFLPLNHLGHIAGDGFWANLTILGDGAVALVSILPVIRRSPRRFWAALIAAVIAALWVQVWKNTINIPRPLSVFSPDQFFHTGPEFRAVSFPSGHATAISAIAGIWIISLAGQRLLRWLLLVLAVLVSVSRIMTGVHWPLDVLGGMLGGWLAACAGLMLVDRCGWGTCGISGCIAGIGMIGVAAALLVSDHMGQPAAMPLQRAVAAVCLIWGAREMVMLLPYRHRRGPPRGSPPGENAKRE
jgi:membrane-associated phospholipid phosphatase